MVQSILFTSRIWNQEKQKLRISIDGVDVLNGQSLLVNPNDTTELEGFLNDCIAKNKFKFIPKTEEISEYRGDKIEDGLIRVEFWYEKLKPITQHINQVFNPNPNPWWVHISSQLMILVLLGQLIQI